MKFIFADSLDYVDPSFDFINDRYHSGRQPYWDDAFPHEILGFAPYDGVLVSRGIIGDHRVSGKYTTSQARRFEMVGARKFLRLDAPNFEHLNIFGDCGAFTYANEAVPPYTPAEIAEFYDDCGFTHGCSVDHIIFDFNQKFKGLDGGSERAKTRFDITLANAETFLNEVNSAGARFQPIGVVQGWSPGSMAEAARRLVAMGYNYLALGGMVPLKAQEIKICLSAVREVVPPSTRLHILGFAKADAIDSFSDYNIESIDTTSPLIRAFKDSRQNYYLPGSDTSLRYFTALRIPQALENPRLKRAVRRGVLNTEDLLAMERNALTSLRAYGRGDADIEETLQCVLEYNAPLIEEKPLKDCVHSPKIRAISERYRETLKQSPWKQCGCPICKDVGVEVIIFRGSNRNKRRGIHNLTVYNDHIKKLESNRALT